MAEPHSLNIGDAVTHPDWPLQTVRNIVGITAFMRQGWNAAGTRRKLVPDPNVRVIHLDSPVKDSDGMEDDAWMEAGLVCAGRAQEPSPIKVESHRFSLTDAEKDKVMAEIEAEEAAS